MAQALKEVGEEFRHRRKEMNLSLKEVENSTSIRAAYLQAIEEGELSRLISPVYAQGFVRQYAAFLGIDSEKIIKEHPEIFNKKVVDSNDFSYGIGTLETRSHPGSGVKAIPNAVWVIGFVVILIVAWLLARFLEVI